MGTKNSKTREHVIRQPLNDAITRAMATGSSNAELLEEVMRTLEQQRMIAYSPKDELALLSPTGRVLVAIMEDPSLTQRALSVYMGVTESSIQKSIKQLIDAKLLIKHKNNGRNVYSVNKEILSRHSDITRFYDGIRGVSTNVDAGNQDEESPF